MPTANACESSAIMISTINMKSSNGKLKNKHNIVHEKISIECGIYYFINRLLKNCFCFLRENSIFELSIRDVGLVLSLASLSISSVSAHIPHDETQGFAVSGGAVFTYVRRQLYRSLDFGLTWEPVSSGLFCLPQSPAEPGDHSKFSVPVAASEPALADERPVVFFVCRNQVHRSDDLGESFEMIGTFDGSGAQRVLISPAFDRDRSILMTTAAGSVFKSSDAGSTWQRLARPGDITAADWQEGTIILGDASGRIHVSHDDAATWVEDPGEAIGSRIADIASARDEDGSRHILIATMRGLLAMKLGPDAQKRWLIEGKKVNSAVAFRRNGQSILLASLASDGILRSTDGGKTWRARNDGLHTHEQAIEYRFDHFGDLTPLADGSVLLASFAGVYRSIDLGAHWHKVPITFSEVLGLSTTRTGMDTYLVLLSTYGSGIAVSDDQGASWTYRNAGLVGIRSTVIASPPDKRSGNVLMNGSFGNYSLAILDPIIWTGRRIPRFPALSGSELAPTPLSAAISPDYARDGLMFWGMYPNGIVKSRGVPGDLELIATTRGSVRSIAMSPRFRDDGMIFAAMDDEILGSYDFGLSWQTIFSGNLGSVKLAISPGFAEDGTIFAATENGLFRTRNHGRTWQEISFPATTRKILAFAVAPDFREIGRIFLQADAGDLLLGDLENDKVEWSAAILPNKTDIIHSIIERERQNLIAFSPFYNEDRTLYGASGLNVMKSVDAGKTWNRTAQRPIRFEAESVATNWILVPIRSRLRTHKEGFHLV